MRYWPVLLLITLGCTQTNQYQRFESSHYESSQRTVSESSSTTVVNITKPKAIEGIHATVSGDVITVEWSYPVTNDKSQLPAKASVMIVLNSLYSNKTFTDSADVTVMPNQMRLAGSILNIPIKNFSMPTLAKGADVSYIFNQVQWPVQWSNIIANTGPLQFSMKAETKTACTIQWTATIDDLPAVITTETTSQNGKVIEVKQLSTTWQIEAVCTLVDQDRKPIATDTRKAKQGERSVTGQFNLNLDQVKTINWNKCSVEFTQKPD